MLSLAACASLQWPAGDAPRDLLPLLAGLEAERQRRISRFDALALAGAALCRDDAGALDPRAAVYLCCEQPNLEDTAALLRQMDDPRLPVKPFQFVNVSSNMTGFRVAQALGISGPNLTQCRSGASLAAALELAQLGGPGRPALIGYVEPCAWPLQQHRERLGLAPGTALAECSHWLYFDAAARPRATIEHCLRYADAAAAATLTTLLRGDERFAAGPGLEAAEAVEWMQRLGLRQASPVTVEGYSRGLPARALVEFAQARDSVRLLHLDRGDTGEYYAILAASAG